MRLTESIGDLPQITALLDSQTDVSMQDENGRTALHGAASNGHAEVVKLLLDAKADVNAQDEADIRRCIGRRRTGTRKW